MLHKFAIINTIVVTSKPILGSIDIKLQPKEITSTDDGWTDGQTSRTTTIVFFYLNVYCRLMAHIKLQLILKKHCVNTINIINL